MRNTDSFLSHGERHPTRRLCYSRSADTQLNRTNFMTRKVPIERGINIEITVPRKAFE